MNRNSDFKSKAVENTVVGLARPTGCLPIDPSTREKPLLRTARSLKGVRALQLPKNPLVGRAVPSAPLSLVGTIPAVNCQLSTVNCHPSISHLQSPISHLQSSVFSLQSAVCSLPSSASPVPAVNCPIPPPQPSTLHPQLPATPPSSRVLSIIGFIFAITVAAADVPAQSQPFKPRLSLDVSTRYTDNLLIDPTTKIKDFSEVISPRVGFLYGNPNRTYIDLDYRAEIERYFTYEKYNANNQFVTLDTQAQFDHATIKLKHSFQDVSSPSYEVIGFSREQVNTTAATGEYRLNSKTSAGLNYHQEFHNWLTSNRIDYRQFVVGSTFYYHLLPKTDLLGQFNQGWVEMDRGANAIYEELNVGFRGQLTSKITGLATVGYQHREYAGTVPSWNEPVASIELRAQFTDRINAALTAFRTITPSSTYLDCSYIRNNADLEVKYLLFRTVRLSAGGGYDNIRNSVPAQNYARERLSARIGVSHDFTKWLRLGANYYYTGNDYTIAGPAMQNAVSLHVKIHY